MKNKIMWLMYILIFVNATVMADNSAIKNCDEILSSCKAPRQGPPGPPGPAGTSGLSDFLWTYNDAGILGLTLGVGVSVPFNGVPVARGTGITQLSPDIFLLRDPGYYQVNFVGYTALIGLLGGVQLHLNGAPIGATTTLISLGTPLIINQIVASVVPNATLQVTATGLAVGLAAGTSATISIVKLAPFP